MAGAAGGRSRLLSNFAPDRRGLAGLGRGLHGNGADFSRFDLSAYPTGICWRPSLVAAV
jgi:hypothetical protein